MLGRGESGLNETCAIPYIRLSPINVSKPRRREKENNRESFARARSESEEDMKKIAIRFLIFISVQVTCGFMR